MTAEQSAVIDRSNGLRVSAGEMRRYAGKWVATRAGKIVASSETYAELLTDPHRKGKDAMLFVPRSPNTYF